MYAKDVSLPRQRCSCFQSQVSLIQTPLFTDRRDIARMLLKRAFNKIHSLIPIMGFYSSVTTFCCRCWTTVAPSETAGLNAPLLWPRYNNIHAWTIDWAASCCREWLASRLWRTRSSWQQCGPASIQPWIRHPSQCIQSMRGNLFHQVDFCFSSLLLSSWAHEHSFHWFTVCHRTMDEIPLWAAL